MKALAWTVAVWFMIAGSIFINGKLRNDGMIARDTSRCADALEQLMRNNYLSAQVKEVRLR